MKRISLFFSILVLSLASSTAIPTKGDDAPPTNSGTASISLELIPQGLLDGRKTQLYITVESVGELKGAVLEITSPTSFIVDDPKISLPAFNRSIICSTGIAVGKKDLLSDEYAFTVTLTVSDGTNGRKTLATKLVKFKYAAEVGLWTFFLLGAIGLVLGYWIRLIVKVLAGVTPPSPAPERSGDGQQDGPITTFVKKHYYSVDFFVTALIAFLLLATLCQGGRPPQSGATWYGALATGVGLGLFTNSELLTKLKR